MADYLPKFLPGKAVTALTSAVVTGGQLVYVTGNGTVGPAGAAANIPVGVASRDAASGASLGYYARGTVHRLTASGTVTAGDLVEAATGGAVATHTVGTNDGRVFGIALTTATTGNSVEIMEV